MKRMLSGIKPTGKLTLGNYIGAIRPISQYQNEYDIYFFIANLHCLTIYQDPTELKKNLKDALALYIACGIDPNKCTLFLQTDIKEHAELGYILACNTQLGELNRMTQYKDKINKGEKNLNAGLYTYPSLMAADILLYSPDYVPVGEDQKQHVELARDIAIRFNNKYGETFKIPEPLITKVGKRILSLQDPTKKMSKSDNGSEKGCIFLLDDINVARKKIMSAVTDSVGKIQIDKENQPGLYNLLEIASSLSNESIETIANNFKDKGYGEFKTYVANIVCDTLNEIQNKYKQIIESNVLDKILNEGKEKANAQASKMLKNVETKLGIDIH